MFRKIFYFIKRYYSHGSLKKKKYLKIIFIYFFEQYNISNSLQFKTRYYIRMIHMLLFYYKYRQ